MVKLVYYRHGKEQTTSVTLAKTAGFGDFGHSTRSQNDITRLQNEINGMLKGDMKDSEGPFGNIKID